jgi:AcrR family transcriptional regulator
MARAEPQAAIVRGRPIGDQAARRRDIAEATLSVIAQSGLDGATLRAIAREASCTTGVLSHYFANKDDVLAFALESIFDALDDGIDRRSRRGTGLGALRAVARSALPIDDESRSLVYVWQSYVSRAEHNDRLAEILRRRHGQVRDRFTALVERGQEDGSIRTDIAAEDLGDVVNACIDGFARMAPLEAGRLPRHRLLELIDIQLRLIAA